MTKRSLCVLALMAALARLSPSASAAQAQAANVVPEGATAAELVEICRRTIPADIEVEGRLILRNRRGMVQAEYSYRMVRKAGGTDLKVFGKDGAEMEFSREGRILGTDVTWSDITLDYLWWNDFAFDKERESESVHGQKCLVILMRSGERLVRVWVDRKTGALMQAEEFRGEKSVRRLWGTRIKKFGDRWAPNVLEVETTGSGHRTKITVEKLT